jgi:hypothetical protein
MIASQATADWLSARLAFRSFAVDAERAGSTIGLLRPSSKMMGAEGQEKDDRQRNAEEHQENGSHGLGLFKGFD